MRIDTGVVRRGGRDITQLIERVSTDMSAAEREVTTAADHIGQAKLSEELTELVRTWSTTRARVLTAMQAFADEVGASADTLEQTDADLAAQASPTS